MTKTVKVKAVNFQCSVPYLTEGKTYEAVDEGGLYRLKDDQGVGIYALAEGSSHGCDFVEVPEEAPKLMEVTGTWKTPVGFHFTIGKQYEYKDTSYGFEVEHDDVGGFCACRWDDCTSGYTYSKVEDIVEEEEPKVVTNEKGHKKVVITKDVGGWPVGFEGWYDGFEKVHNDNYTEHWYHTVGSNCEYVEEPKPLLNKLHPDAATEAVREFLEDNGFSLVKLHLLTQAGNEFMA